VVAAARAAPRGSVRFRVQGQGNVLLTPLAASSDGTVANGRDNATRQDGNGEGRVLLPPWRSSLRSPERDPDEEPPAAGSKNVQSSLSPSRLIFTSPNRRSRP